MIRKKEHTNRKRKAVKVESVGWVQTPQCLPLTSKVQFKCWLGCPRFPGILPPASSTRILPSCLSFRPRELGLSRSGTNRPPHTVLSVIWFTAAQPNTLGKASLPSAITPQPWHPICTLASCFRIALLYDCLLDQPRSGCGSLVPSRQPFIKRMSNRDVCQLRSALPSSFAGRNLVSRVPGTAGMTKGKEKKNK